MSKRLLLQLGLTHDWDQIDVVRQAVSLCVGAVFGAANLKDAIAMVSSELLENAVKHGVPATPVTLEVEEKADLISIAVTNHVRGVCAVTPLVERLTWLSTFENSSTAYAAAMQKASRERTEGGLGLPRIAHEGGCSVTCDTSNPEVVTVCATLRRAMFLEAAQ